MGVANLETAEEVAAVFLEAEGRIEASDERREARFNAEDMTCKSRGRESMVSVG